MKYSDGAKMFIACLAGAALICVVIFFLVISDDNRASRNAYQQPQQYKKAITCNENVKVISKQDLIQDLSDMRQGTVLCVERVVDGLWKERDAR